MNFIFLCLVLFYFLFELIYFDNLFFSCFMCSNKFEIELEQKEKKIITIYKLKSES